MFIGTTDKIMNLIKINKNLPKNLNNIYSVIGGMQILHILYNKNFKKIYLYDTNHKMVQYAKFYINNIIKSKNIYDFLKKNFGIINYNEDEQNVNLIKNYLEKKLKFKIDTIEKFLLYNNDNQILYMNKCQCIYLGYNYLKNNKTFIKLKNKVLLSKIIYLNISIDCIHKYFQKKKCKDPDFLFITNINEYVGKDKINIYMNKIIYSKRNNMYISNRYNIFKIKSFINEINKINKNCPEGINKFLNNQHTGWGGKFFVISMYNYNNLIKPIKYNKLINYKNIKKYNNKNYIFLNIKNINLSIQNNIFNHINVSTKEEIFLKYRNIKNVLKVKDIIIDDEHKVLDGFHALSELILRGYKELPFRIRNTKKNRF